MRLRLLSLYGDLRHVPPLRGLRRFGVPRGGPFDSESAILAAALAHVPVERVIELAFGAATFVVEDGGTLAIVGSGRAERIAVTTGGSLTLVPDRGARLALAASGGWVPPIIGADPEASLTIPVGSALEAPAHAPLSPRRLYVSEATGREAVLRVVAGPQRDRWTGDRPLLTVGALLDRRGVRIHGAPTHEHEIASEPCVPGVVQWTPGGELIVLGPDGPTIGGYPKPFVVIGADLTRVGQLRPGDPVRLVEIDAAGERRADESARAELARRLVLLRLTDAVPGKDSGQVSG